MFVPHIRLLRKRHDEEMHAGPWKNMGFRESRRVLA
jgi:hypothetical protein